MRLSYAMRSCSPKSLQVAEQIVLMLINIVHQTNNTQRSQFVRNVQDAINRARLAHHGTSTTNQSATLRIPPHDPLAIVSAAIGDRPEMRLCAGLIPRMAAEDPRLTEQLLHALEDWWQWKQSRVNQSFTTMAERLNDHGAT
jgi:hypothetical protein